MITNGEHVKKGMLVQREVMGSPYFVMDVKKETIVLFGETGVVEDGKWDGIYYTVLKGQITPQKMLNTKSGVSHYVINGRSLCGTVGDSSNLTETDNVTCKHCKEHHGN